MLNTNVDYNFLIETNNDMFNYTKKKKNVNQLKKSEN